MARNITLQAWPRGGVNKPTASTPVPAPKVRAQPPTPKVEVTRNYDWHANVGPVPSLPSRRHRPRGGGFGGALNYSGYGGGRQNDNGGFSY